VTVGGSAPESTTVNGAYRVSGISPGTYSVTYSQSGYVTQTVGGLVIAAGGTTTQDVALVPDASPKPTPTPAPTPTPTPAPTPALTPTPTPPPTPTSSPTPTPIPIPTPTPTPTPKVTLKLSGLRSGALKLGRSVAATGRVTYTSLIAGRVTLAVQLKKGATWVKVKTVSATIIFTGTYSWKYKPAKKGAYRMQATIAKTTAHAAATTKWLRFKVK